MAPAQQVRHAHVSRQNCERIHTHRTHSAWQQETRGAQVIAARTCVPFCEMFSASIKRTAQPMRREKEPEFHGTTAWTRRRKSRVAGRTREGKARPAAGKRLLSFKETEAPSSSPPLSPVKARARYGTPRSRRSRRVQVNGRTRVRWRNTCVARATSAPEARQHFPRAIGRAIAQSPCGDWPRD